MGVDLDEHPLGAALDVDPLVDPGRHPRRGGWIVTRERAVLDPHAGALARDRERAGDHQQAIVVVPADAGALAVVVAAASREVAGRPVDLVDLVGLTRIRSRGERQVRVAAERVQQRELVVDAAPAPIGPAVRERPVAVDERPLIAAPVAREVAVLREQRQGALELRRERRGGVVVVVEVDLDLAEPRARELGEAGEEVRAVLLAGEEPPVARWAPIAVAEPPEVRIALGPRIHAGAPDLVRGTPVEWLVVIAQREQDVARSARL